MIPGLTLLPGQFGNAPSLAELPLPNDTIKMEGPAWNVPDPTGQDKKQHPVNNDFFLHLLFDDMCSNRPLGI